MLLLFLIAIPMVLSHEYAEVPYYIPKNISTDSPQLIPKVIYQFSSVNPVHVNSYQATLDTLKINPDYDYYFFNETMAETLIQDECGDDIYHVYLQFKPKTFRSDIFRYCILWSRGGVYLDMKSSIIEPISSFMHPDSEYTGFMNASPFSSYLMTTPIFAIKGSKIMKEALNLVIQTAAQKSYSRDPLDVTGPGLLQRAFINTIGILPNIGRFDKVDIAGQEQICPQSHDFNHFVNGKKVVKMRWYGYDSWKATLSDGNYLGLYYNKNIYN